MLTAAGLRTGLAAAMLSVALGLSACGGMKELIPDMELRSFLSKASDVDFGMTKAQVQYTMGKPTERVYQDSQEAWLWCQTSKSQDRADAFLTVYFHNARVAGIHTYGNRAEGQCEGFFRRVEWLAEPEREMAARKRRREN